MTRLAVAALALSTLTACYDFVGDKGRVGFSTNATLDGITEWTPAARLASGATPIVTASEHLDTEETPVAVAWSADGSVAMTPLDADALQLEGPRRGGGAVEAVADGVQDRFVAKWAPPVRGALHDPYDWFVDRDRGLTEARILEGHQAAFLWTLHDRSGRPLGWTAEQLEVEGRGAVSAWLHEGVVMVSADQDGPGTVTVGWAGGPEQTLQVWVVGEREIDSIDHQRGTVAGVSDGLMEWTVGRTARGEPIFGLMALD